MKLLFVCFATFILCSSTTCHKKLPEAGLLHTGKVIGALCGNITVQFTDGSLLGQNGWSNKQDMAGKTYDHVFKVANSCTWGNAAANSDIRFKFVPPAPQNCMQCMAYAPTPDTAYSIEIVP